MGIYGAVIASIVSYNVGGIILSVYFCKVSGARFREMIFINKEDLKILKQLKKSK